MFFEFSIEDGKKLAGHNNLELTLLQFCFESAAHATALAQRAQRKTEVISVYMLKNDPVRCDDATSCGAADSSKPKASLRALG